MKVERITYKQRFFAVIFGLVILTSLSYQRAIKGTLEMAGEVSLLEERVTDRSTLEIELAHLQRLNQKLRLQLGNTEIDVDQVRQDLLKETIAYCESHSLNIKALPESHEYKESDYRLVTNTFVVEGIFKDLLGLNYYLEQSLKISRVSSVDYYIEKDKRTRKEKLYARYVLQNISKS